MQPVSVQKNLKGWVLVSVLVVVLLMGGGLFWLKTHKSTPVETRNTSHVVSSVASAVKDIHRWNPEPVEVKDLDLAKGLFGFEEKYPIQVKAWDIGTYSEGYGIQSHLDDARMVLVFFRDYQAGVGVRGGGCDRLFRIFIGKSQAGNLWVETDGTKLEDIGFIAKERTPTRNDALFSVNPLGGTQFIPSMQFPGFVVHDGKPYVIQSANPCYFVDEQGKSIIFFNDIKDSLQQAGFSDPMLGPAYKDDKGLVFRAPDGTYVRYRPQE